ncbi:hypothetical protein CAPTEDRAFT_213962 [Capitella teleta]|uniref:Uncharacterized protein n=1 Tax=Capitella teleta TaxID=283909 RepID=R7T361_CAPTE|nr:hypothetical protein CAPTEDRAFT_213962 [Capitella teleta]|eukprot:ELT86991.1 hypothetical protein CAPTEDRAFT_213962 [Capitella teleta]
METWTIRYFRGRRNGGDGLMTASLLKNACPFPKSLRGTWNEDLGGGVILTEIGQHSLSLERDGHQYNALCYGKSPDERIFLISSVHGGKYYSSCLRLKTDFMSRRQFFTKVGMPSEWAPRLSLNIIQLHFELSFCWDCDQRQKCGIVCKENIKQRAN